MKKSSLLGRAGILLFAALLFLFPITASAAEADMPTGGEAAVTAPLEAPKAHAVSADIADVLRENAATILAGATFLLTVFLSFVFKKRLIPSLLDALSNLLGKGHRALDEITARQSAEGERIDALLNEIGALLADAHDAAARAEEAAALVKEKDSAAEELRAVLSTEAELLFSLLLSANLPQYEKDRVAAVYAKIADRIGACHD